MLDYPGNFPRMVALTQLDASMWFLAKRYAAGNYICFKILPTFRISNRINPLEFLGQCYVSNSYILTIPRNELLELAINPKDEISHLTAETPIDTNKPILSLPANDIQTLDINVGHGIAIAVYIEDARSSSTTNTTDQSIRKDSVNLYLKESGENFSHNSVDIRWLYNDYGSATVNILPSQVSNTTVQCILKIVLPSVTELKDQTLRAALQQLSISIKEGRILAEHVVFDRITARIGRGLVEARVTFIF